MTYWTTAKIVCWGNSMYGGYYAECIIKDERITFHAPTLKEMRKQLEKEFSAPCADEVVFKRSKRIDNI